MTSLERDLTLTRAEHPALDPILAIQSFYVMAAGLAVARGMDPDQPRHLSKVTVRTERPPVGASLLAMDVNDNAGSLNARVVLRFFASKLAPTEKHVDPNCIFL